MNAPNAALGCVLVFLAIICVSLTIGHLFYFVAVILELAKTLGSRFLWESSGSVMLPA